MDEFEIELLRYSLGLRSHLGGEGAGLMMGEESCLERLERVRRCYPVIPLEPWANKPIA
jgi:hypothetical protein